MAVLKKVVTLGLVAACSPDWRTQMKEKPKGDWTSNEAAEFAKTCLM